MRKGTFRPAVLELEARCVPAVNPMVQVTGAVTLSVDGVGTNGSTGTVQVQKPVGASVRSAYLVSAMTRDSAPVLADGDVTLDGATVSWSSVVANNIGSSNAWADVTSLVKPKVDSAAPGRVNFTIAEPLRTTSIDGEILAVIFDDPSVITANTIVIFFGSQNPGGDSFSLLLGNPVDKSDPRLVMDMSVGISFSAQPSTPLQYSQIVVNGQRMTTAAGGQDDATGSGGNGTLLTVGGLDDTHANPANPLATPSAARDDDELYDLLPFVNDGATNITVDTLNPTNDDNIFFAAINLTTPAVVGEGIVLSPSADTRNLGANQSVTASLQHDDGSPLVGTNVTFTIVAGPHAGMTANVATDANGQASFVYSGTLPGTDQVQATFVNSLSQSVTSNTVTTTWIGGVTVALTGGSTQVSEAGGTDTYTVVLESAPQSPVTINLNPGNQLAVSSTSLDFNASNWNVPQTVTVFALNDNVAQGLRTVTLSHTATSGDLAYNNVSIAAVQVAIVDDDVPGIQLSTPTVQLAEGNPASSYSVVLTSQPTANITLAISQSAQVKVVPTSLTFTPSNWNVAQTVRVTAVDDTRVEGLQNYTITHSARSTYLPYNGMSATLTAAVADNDFAKVIVNQAAPVELLEGASKAYTVVLSHPPSSEVAVTANSDPGFSVSPASMSFTKFNWNIPRTFTLTAVDDDEAQGNHLGIVSHSVVSSDAIYTGVLASDVTAQVLDNDGTVINGTSGSDKIVVDMSAGLSQMTVSVNGVVTPLPDTTVQLVILAGSGNDSIQLNSPILPILVLGGLGTDPVTVAGQSAANYFILDNSLVNVNGADISLLSVENLNLIGQADSDVFQLFSMPAGNVDIKGEGGTDQIIGPDLVNTWKILADNAGILNKTVKLTSIEDWSGGLDNDTFSFTAGRRISGLIDSGGGYDVLDFSSYTTPIVINMQSNSVTGTGGFANVTKIRGGRGVDSIFATNQTNQWNVTGNGIGDLNYALAFENVENLNGGSLDDTFLFANNASIKGKIDGGGGTDVLSFAGYQTTSVRINLDARTATNTGGWVNIEQFQGGGGAFDTVTGANKQNVWTFTGANAFHIDGLRFSDIESVAGGTLNDLFQLEMNGKWTGTLSGGPGFDSLVASSMVTNVFVSSSLYSGTLNGRKFTSIEEWR